MKIGFAERASSSRSLRRSALDFGTANANGAMTFCVATEPISKIGESTAALVGKSRYVTSATASSSAIRGACSAKRSCPVSGATVTVPDCGRRASIRALLHSRVAGVRLDDVPHQAVTDDVGLAEIVEPDPLDSLQNALYLDQPGLLAPRQIDLRFVARDHGLRVHAESRQEHLHLRVGRVLRFVENHERVRE